MEPQASRSSRRRDACLSTAFALFLFTPAAVLAVRGPESPKTFMENRRPADFPEAPRSAVEWAGWPRAFEAWHDDHYGLRRVFVRSHNILKIWGLDTSPTSRITLGRDKWVFSTGMDLEPWRGGDPFTPLELEGWRQCLESRERELARRGIRYLFVLVPAKAAVYTEYLPSRLRSGGPSRTDQLVEYLAKTSSFRILDLRAALLAGKADDAPGNYQYFPLGLHWNARGGAVGARAIAAELAKLWPSVAAVDDTVARLELADDPGDTWARRLYVDDLLGQKVWSVRFTDEETRPVDVARDGVTRVATVDQADPSLPRAVVFHDSFGESIVEMLGRHFSRSLFVWQTGIRTEFIDREKPDVVIHVLGDRVLDYLVPQEFNAAELDRARVKFQGSSEVALHFDPATNSPRIQAFAQGSVSLRSDESGAAVACKLDAPAGGFLLPEFHVRGGKRAIAHLVFDSPVSGTTSILWQTRTDATYVRRRQYQFEIHVGRNELYVELEDPELAGRLLLRPSTEPGNYLIRAFEVRLVPN